MSESESINDNNVNEINDNENGNNKTEINNSFNEITALNLNKYTVK